MKKLITVLMLLPFALCGATYYVNGTTGKDSNTGLSSSAAKKTIQAAIDVAEDGATIFVAAGTYAPISVSSTKSITIKSISGATVTFIDGGGTSTVANLNSNNAQGSARDANHLIGFTIQNGHGQSGGSGGTVGGTIINCIYRYNYGCGYGGASAALPSLLINCLAYGNTYGSSWGGGVFSNCGVYNCTVVNNTGYSFWDGGAFNSISYGNSKGVYRSSGEDDQCHNCLTESQRKSAYGNITGDPSFENAVNHDYRLTSLSPCVGGGSNEYVDCDDGQDHVSNITDLAGNARVANGTVDIGCYEFGSSSGRLTYYVNGTTGDDSNSGLSSSSAKKTIQAAIDVAEDGATIFVAAGTYAPIVSSNRRMCIASTAGAEWTAIDGQGSTTYAAKLSYGSAPYTNTVLRGFTVLNGRGGVEGGTVENCIIRNNSGIGLGHGIGINCLIVNNVGYNGGGCQGAVLFNCTIVGNTLSGGAGSGTYSCSVNNSIVYNNSMFSLSASYDANEWWGKLGYQRSNNVCTSDPKFVDIANGDYHLSSDSPCIDAGNNAYVRSATDFDGNDRIANAVVDIGCYEFGSAPIAAGDLVAWYKFDGDATDSSDYGNDGVVHGAMLTKDRFGNANCAYMFDGDDSIVVADSISLQSVTNKMTFSVWLKSSLEDECFVPIIQKGATTKGRQFGLFLGFSSTYGYRIIINDYNSTGVGNTVEVSLLKSNFPKDKWYLLSATFDGFVIKGYINGVLMGERAVQDVFVATTASMSIGNGPGTYTGVLDDLRIYNRVLSEEEMYAIYAEGGSDLSAYRTVTFNANGGTVTTGSRRVEDGAAVGTLPTATWDGHEFLGWYTAAVGGAEVSADTKVTADLTLYAHWCKKDATPDTPDSFSSEWTPVGTLDLSTGVRRASDAQMLAYGTSWFDGGANAVVKVDGTTLAEKTDAGVVSWSGSGTGRYSLTHQVFDSQGIQVGETYSATFQWVNRTTVSFIGNLSGVADQTKIYDEGYAYEVLPTASSAGYDFLGWWTTSSGGTKAETNTVVAANAKLYAHWRAHAYTVRFASGGGDGEMANQSFIYGVSQELTTNSFSREGYAFAGWRREDGEKQENYSDLSSVSNLTADANGIVTLVATWEKLQYSVTFDLCDRGTRTGGGALSQTVKWGESATAPTVTPSKNYVFDSWDEAFDCVISNMTVHAKYLSLMPYIGMSVMEGCETMGKVSGGNKNVKTGSKTSLRATANKGYVVEGWYNSLGERLTQEANYSPVAGYHDATYYAKFIETASDWASVEFKVPNEWTTGALIDQIEIDVKGGSLPTVKVTGLPTGLKFTAKLVTSKVTTGSGRGRVTTLVTNALPNTIYGTPTKSGVYTIVATVTTAGKKTANWSQTVVVRKASEKVVKTDVVLIDAIGSIASAEAAPGKVTGMGVYAEGKKVTLRATANKRYVFAGWYPVDAIASIAPEGDEKILTDAFETNASTCISRSASLVMDKMPANDVEFVAAFITAECDKANIAATVNGVALDAWVSKDETRAFATNIWTGVYLEWPVAASALSATTVKVVGLPSGLKFTAKDVTQKIGTGKTAQTVVVVPANTIYGAPSAASKTAKDKKTGAVTVTPSQVKVTVTTAGKSSQTYQIDTTVDPLPSWVVGTFTGPSYAVGDGTPTLPDTGAGVDGYYVVGSAPCADRVETNGLATVTIGANGKISAKQPVNGKSTSFAASYFDCYVTDENAFYATLTAKVGNEVVSNKMAVGGGLIEAALPAGGSVIVTNGYIEADRFDAWQYNWKSEPWKTIGKSIDKRILTYVIKADGAISESDEDVALPLGADIAGRVTLKFAASGAVTASGEFVSGYDKKKAKYTTVKATGSATLVPSGDGHGLVFVYLSPKGLSVHTRCVTIPLSGE